MENYDFVLKNGHLIDPKNEIDEIMDIAVLNKNIVKIDKNIDKLKKYKI